MLPNRVVLRLVNLALTDATGALERKSRHNAASTSEGVLTARKKQMAQLLTQRAAVNTLMAACPSGELPAAHAGLLAAWALGHQPALVELEEVLETLGHTRAQEIAELQSGDVAGACRLLMGGK